MKAKSMTKAWKIAEYRINEKLNGVEITFTEKPAEAIRAELKALGFRWGRGYWYAKQTPERIALAARLADGEEPKKTEERKTTKQDHILFYYNGIKVDGALVRCYYYIDRDNGDVHITARDYKDLPRDVFDVTNGTDIYTDYFEEDGTTLSPDHPLYKYALYAATKSAARDAKRHAEWIAKRSQSSQKAYAGELERGRATVAAFEAMEDPGQPTAEDLEAIDRQRQKEENARREAEHAAELAEREKVLAERRAGFEYINQIAERYPIKDGEPVVYIPFSENPAFYSFMVEDEKRVTLHPDGTKTEEVITKMPRCVLSVKAAEVVLNHYDINRAAQNLAEGRGGYDKTDFIIKWTDESGEPWEYSGRYDLGDNDGGLIKHIEALAEWDRTHTTQEINESRAAWVDLLKRYAEAA